MGNTSGNYNAVSITAPDKTGLLTFRNIIWDHIEVLWFNWLKLLPGYWFDKYFCKKVKKACLWNTTVHWIHCTHCTQCPQVLPDPGRPRQAVPQHAADGLQVRLELGPSGHGAVLCCVTGDVIYMDGGTGVALTQVSSYKGLLEWYDISSVKSMTFSTYF